MQSVERLYSPSFLITWLRHFWLLIRNNNFYVLWHDLFSSSSRAPNPQSPILICGVLHSLGGSCLICPDMPDLQVPAPHCPALIFQCESFITNLAFTIWCLKISRIFLPNIGKVKLSNGTNTKQIDCKQIFFKVARKEGIFEGKMQLSKSINQSLLIYSLGSNFYVASISNFNW